MFSFNTDSDALDNYMCERSCIHTPLVHTTHFLALPTEILEHKENKYTKHSNLINNTIFHLKKPSFFGKMTHLRTWGENIKGEAEAFFGEIKFRNFNNNIKEKVWWERHFEETRNKVKELSMTEDRKIDQ